MHERRVRLQPDPGPACFGLRCAPAQTGGPGRRTGSNPRSASTARRSTGSGTTCSSDSCACCPAMRAGSSLHGLEKLDLGRGGVPDFAAMSEELRGLTGWSVVPVPMLIPDHVFYYHLANRRFPAGNFIRTREQFDYIQEPDVFHDVFGHVPLLTDPIYADYMAAYGRAGWKALKYNRLKALSALYWYTVEFGLILEDDAMRIYGAGILSGPTETVFAVEGRSPASHPPERRSRDAHRLHDLGPAGDLFRDRVVPRAVPPDRAARLRADLRIAGARLPVRQDGGARHRSHLPSRHAGIRTAWRSRLRRHAPCDPPGMGGGAPGKRPVTISP